MRRILGLAADAAQQPLLCGGLTTRLCVAHAAYVHHTCACLHTLNAINEMETRKLQGVRRLPSESGQPSPTKARMRGRFDERTLEGR